MRTRAHEEGFSLIEVVIVIALTGIVAALISSFITRPFAAYGDIRVRAQLVDSADNALQRLARDLRRALPNSIRVSGGAIEFLNTSSGARYRRDPGVNAATAEDHTAATDVLDFAGDLSFNALGRLTGLAFTYDVPLAAGHRIAIYSTGAGVWADAAKGANPGVITPASMSVTIRDDVDEDRIELSGGAPFRFALESPRRRLYVVDAPVSFLCDTLAGTLTRYSSYAIAATQPTSPLLAPLSAASAGLVATDVTGCAFTYQPGTSERAGLVTLDLTLARSGEQVRLLQQVHVVNVP